MAGLFECDRRLYDRARAVDAKAGASACAVATGLVGCRLIDGQGPSVNDALVSCPFSDCGASHKEERHVRASKTGPGWVCACMRRGDTVDMVREVKGFSFGQTVDALTDFIATPRDDATGDMFGFGQ